MITYLWFCWINLVGFGWVFREILREIWKIFGKMRVIMDERASARFVAGAHRQLTTDGFLGS